MIIPNSEFVIDFFYFTLGYYVCDKKYHNVNDVCFRSDNRRLN